eukprot:CAMPEP_0170109644 /NCGR_PEP_ID=MMETSP0020_2-20130122/7344_1 /TAXON_ID=98059 /ORGANISM="Dinobryon sp., Strain UTEXLB2267" /LENGTH=133 /DNA_ID=CAMNT_0010334705 /DNA_START=522 /DNA_END=919 /DNA_ORIENTATION=-
MDRIKQGPTKTVKTTSKLLKTVAKEHTTDIVNNYEKSSSHIAGASERVVTNNDQALQRYPYVFGSKITEVPLWVKSLAFLSIDTSRLSFTFKLSGTSELRGVKYDILEDALTQACVRIERYNNEKKYDLMAAT